MFVQHASHTRRGGGVCVSGVGCFCCMFLVSWLPGVSGVRDFHVGPCWSHKSRTPETAGNQDTRNRTQIDFWGSLGAGSVLERQNKSKWTNLEPKGHHMDTKRTPKGRPKRSKCNQKYSKLSQNVAKGDQTK